MLLQIVGAAALFVASAGMVRPQEANDGDRWVPFDGGDQGQYFYDRETVQRSGDIVRFRVREVVPEAVDAPIRSMILGMELDCAAQTNIAFRVETYDAAGTLLQAFGPSDGSQAGSLAESPIHPGTRDEVLYRMLCPADSIRPIVLRVAEPLVMPQPAPTE